MALDSISKRLAEWYSSNTITRHPPRTLSFTLLQHGNEWKNSTLQQVNSRPVSYACTQEVRCIPVYRETIDRLEKERRGAYHMIGCCLLSCLSSPTLSNRIALGVSPTTVPRRRYCVLLNMPYEHVSVFSFHRLERDDGGQGKDVVGLSLSGVLPPTILPRNCNSTSSLIGRPLASLQRRQVLPAKRSLRRENRETER